jgi:hypothetical protein
MNDPYFDTDICVERLYEQYQKHPRLIIAVDFDDTIFDFHKKGHKYEHVIEIIKEAQKNNFYIVLFSASRPERYQFMKDYASFHGINVDSINKNCIESPFGNDGKIFYNILLDDRAGLGQSYVILRKLLDRIKT